MNALQAKIGEFFDETTNLRISILLLYEWKEFNEVKKFIAFMEKFPFLQQCVDVKYNLWNLECYMQFDYDTNSLIPVSSHLISLLHFVAQRFQLIELKTHRTYSGNEPMKTRRFRMQTFSGSEIKKTVKVLKEVFVCALKCNFVRFWLCLEIIRVNSSAVLCLRKAAECRL